MNRLGMWGSALALVLVLMAFLFVLMAYYLYTTLRQQRMAER